MTRRQFLFEAAAGGALLGSGLRQLGTRIPGVRGTGAQDKPALTVRSINEYIATAQREDESTRMLLAAEVKRNLVAFLDQRFALSEQQRRALGSLTDEDRRRINVAVEMSLGRGRRLLFRSTASPGEAAVAESARAPTPTATFSLSGDTSASHGTTPNGDVILIWPCPGVRGKA